jgi:type I restriction enzyme S subunit
MGSEFQLVRLDEVCQNVSRAFPLKTKEKAIFVNTGDVSQGEFLHYNYSDVASLPGQAKKAILTGDILFSEIRPGNGRFAKVESENTGDFVVSTKFMVIDLITATMNRDFFYLQLTSKKTLEEFQKIAESRSGTFPQITFDAIGHYPIYKPELETQQTISSWLLSFERKLKLNKELNQTLEQMAQTLFKSWFVDFDPVIDNALAAGNPIPDVLQERAEFAPTGHLRTRHQPQTQTTPR